MRDNKSHFRTQDQKRASYALRCVKEAGDGIGAYCDLARKLPTMILVNGLEQSLAFACNQSGAKQKLYKHLMDWLTDPKLNNGTAVYPSDVQPNPFSIVRMDCILSGSCTALKLATKEALAVSQWLKRFAEIQEEASKPGARSSLPAGS